MSISIINYRYFCRSVSPFETSSEPETEDFTSAKNRRNASSERCSSNVSPTNRSKRVEAAAVAPPATKDRLTVNAIAKEQRIGETSSECERKCARVVKNLNEFLNFTSLNRSKVGPSDDRELRRVSSESGVIRVVREDGSGSPDDPTEFFPMTTSMTRELRLELESLDRQVFGPSPTAEQQNCDCIVSKREGEIMESETETEVARCSPAADVFVWENPLHTLQQRTTATTPDEQADLEYDGEILEDQNGVKSVTPIRLLKRTARCVFKANLFLTLLYLLHKFELI